MQIMQILCKLWVWFSFPWNRDFCFFSKGSVFPSLVLSPSNFLILTQVYLGPSRSTIRIVPVSSLDLPASFQGPPWFGAILLFQPNFTLLSCLEPFALGGLLSHSPNFPPARDRDSRRLGLGFQVLAGMRGTLSGTELCRR